MRFIQRTSRFLSPLVLIGLVSACVAAPVAPAAPAATTAAESPASAVSGDMADLVAAAQAEGTLSTIALPHDWCNYGEMIDAFKAKYGIEVNELDPNAGSGDELEAIRANKDNKGPQAPDVIDVGFAFGPQAQDRGSDSALQGCHLGHNSRRSARMPTATGMATTMACWLSRSITMW